MTKNNSKNKTFFSALVISFGVILSRFTGLLRDIFFASFLGTGIVAETFYVAFRLPNTFRRIFAEGAFSNVFVPFFASKVKENRASANMFSAKVILILLFSLIILTVIFEIFMPSVVKAINPGFFADKEKFELAVLLSRITFPYIILISVTAFFGAILNSIGSFWQFASVSVIMNLVLIFGIIFANSLFSNAGMCLSYFLIISGFLQLFFVAYFCLKNNLYPSMKSKSNITLHDEINNKNDVKNFLKKLVPAILSSGILQVNIFVDGIFASFFTGAVSYLYYTDRIGQFPLSIIGYSLSVAILPSLSIAFKEKKHEKFANLQRKSIDVAIFFSIPAMFLIYTLATPIISMIYEHGVFTPNDTKHVAIMLMIYAISIPFNVLIKIFFACFYAEKNTKTPMQISVFSLVFNIISNIILIHIVGMYCVIISTTASAILSCILSIIFLKKNESFFLKKNNLFFTLKILCISFVSCVILPLMMHNLNLLLILFVAGILHLVLCFSTKTLSFQFIKEIITK